MFIHSGLPRLFRPSLKASLVASLAPKSLGENACARLCTCHDATFCILVESNMLAMQLPLGTKRAIFLSGMSGCEALHMYTHCAYHRLA